MSNEKLMMPDVPVPHHQQSDYDRLRDQCLSAMNEVETLRKGHAETLSRFEKVTQNLEFYKQQHQGACSNLDELQSKYDQVIFDREKLCQDYEDIVLLREAEMNIVKHEPKISPCRDSDLLKREKSDLTYKFDDLKVEHDMLSSKYKLIQEENLKLKEQHDSLLTVKENLNNNYEALKNRCASAIQGFEKALIDRKKAEHDLEHMKRQYENIEHKLQKSNEERAKMSHDFKKLQAERNSVEQEYQLVMSERETVHQEIQELQEKLQRDKDKAKELNKDKEKAFLEKEGFHREIQSVLADRDKARHEVRNLQSRLVIADKERERFARKCEVQTTELEMLKQESKAAKKERNEALVHRDSILKQCFDVKQSFNQMVSGDNAAAEVLNQKFDKLSGQLTEAWKLTEVAMNRRNWAFNERDKVLKAYESLNENYIILQREKPLVDELLRKAITESRSSQKKFKVIHRENDRLKTLLNKGSMLPSQDSAIDTDSSSYQICHIELERKSSDVDFGFKIGGGKMSASSRDMHNTDTSIIVIEVAPHSIADNNNLKLKDCILQANDNDLTNVDYPIACEKIFNTDYLDMRILRYSKTGLKSPLQRFEIKGGEEKTIGLSIDSGLHIKRIEPGSAAAEEETLSIGDKILTINGHSIDNMPYDEAKKLLKTSHLSLTVLKPSVSSTSSHPSLIHHDRDDEKAQSITESGSLASTEGHISSINHVRSPSAPLQLTASPDDSAMNTMYSHVKSMSIIDKMSDDEIRKVLVNLTEEQKRRKELEMIDESNPYRSPSFISAIGRISRPRGSTNSITNSINSSGSTAGKYEPISSPLLNMTRSIDPLALDHARTIGQASSTTTSNTSVNSTQKRLKSPPNRHHPNNTWTGPLRPPYSSDSLNPSNSFSHEQSSAFFTSKKVYHHSNNTDFTSSHHSMNTTSKQGSSRSVVGTDGSISSDFSEHPPSTSTFNNNVVIPVPEEVAELPYIEEYPLSPSVRSSVRSSTHTKPDYGSLTSSDKKSSKRSDSTTPCNEDEQRLITIDKGQNPLGITICEGQPNGIMISGTTEGSIASQYGLKYGDQILEYNGINLRTAHYKQAETILLSGNENTVHILALYNPDKMPLESSPSTQSTPCTPRRSAISSPACKLGRPSGAGSISTPGTPVSMHVRLSSNTSSSSDHSKRFYAEKITPIPENDDVGELRFIHLDREPSSTALGLGIIGGNDIGIFISDIQKGSLASQSNLRCGDQILKYNDKDMRYNTLEEATLELGKPMEVSDLQVQYNPPGYYKAQNQANDSFYVRAQFDRVPHGKGELSFRKGDILHVTETLYKGQLGVWRASLVHENEAGPLNGKTTKGKIPSKRTAEQELLLRRSSSYGDDKSKNRKSIFRRSKKGSSHHAINHSRESSDSKADVESTVSGGTSFVFIPDDFNTYQCVKQLESKLPRPVVIVSAMAEPICDKLVIDWSKRFARCFEVVHMRQVDVTENINNGTYLDFKPSRKGGDRYEVITSLAVKEFASKQSKHCLLDVTMESIERIVNNQLYPIVIYVKFKSGKLIKDMRDDHYIKEKLTTAKGKELSDSFAKLEKDYKHLFNVTINCTNLNQVCKDINEAVVEQQKKVLWAIDE